jgi:hypothetical protein
MHEHAFWARIGDPGLLRHRYFGWCGVVGEWFRVGAGGARAAHIGEGEVEGNPGRRMGSGIKVAVDDWNESRRGSRSTTEHALINMSDMARQNKHETHLRTPDAANHTA